ncbi:hypothetical protein Q9233_015675 [Columba guinea]|nr:hypothetical protein Q9233_015675 [Columba guinea]
MLLLGSNREQQYYSLESYQLYQRQHEDASLMSVELMIDQQNECREEAEYLAGKDYLGKGGSSVMAASGSLKVHRGHSLQAGPKGGYEMLTLPAESGTPTNPEEPEGAVGYSGDVPASDRPHSETATYVNIPVSPTSKKQLHYMELELQEPSTSIRGSGSSRYAQIDIAATETAHKVGTQHAQCREERLQELEQKKKGAQQ